MPVPEDKSAEPIVEAAAPTGEALAPLGDLFSRKRREVILL